MVSKYEVSAHFARCWEVLLGNRGPAGCLSPVGALNFSDAQLKRSDHVG
jgi:hypothetical protein